MEPTPLKTFPVTPFMDKPLGNDATHVARQSIPQHSAISLPDVVYGLSKHRRVVVALAVLGLLAASLTFLLLKPKYVSTSKILIRYVLDSQELVTQDGSGQLRTPDNNGLNLIGSEIEILNSQDLILEVAELIGPNNILGTHSETNALIHAVEKIQKDLEVQLLPKSSVIEISYRHSDPILCSNVVSTLVQRYIRLHARVHRSLDVLDELTEETEQKRLRVERTAADLKQLHSELGITSVKEGQRSLDAMSASIRMELLQKEAELAENSAEYAALKTPAESSDKLAMTGPLPTPATPRTGVLPEENYLRWKERMAALKAREWELLEQFTPTSTYVRQIRDQIRSAQNELDSLVQAHPYLSDRPTLDRDTKTEVRAEPGSNGIQEKRTRLLGLSARIQTLRAQLDALKIESNQIADKEMEISRMEKRLQQMEQQHASLSSALERVKTDSVISTSRVGNISIVQGASPARRSHEKETKVLAGMGGGGLLLGILLALGTEMFVDNSVRRIRQVQEKLGLRTYVAIPDLSPAKRMMLSIPDVSGAHQERNTDTVSALQGYMDSLCHRILLDFQRDGDARKPKLIGVTSCTRGSGVTSMARGLAKSLSRNGDGKVLYVDVSPRNGANASPIHVIEPHNGVCRPKVAAFPNSEDHVAKNLYAVRLMESETPDSRLPSKAFQKLLSTLTLRDYDYIVFDLPEVSQVSPTLRFAGSMDLTLLVLESGKTNSDLAKSAANLLSESGSPLAVVLNRHRRYLPVSMETEI